ncbi:hypothetical protein D3C73_1511140 [compost metagenome]
MASSVELNGPPFVKARLMSYVRKERDSDMKMQMTIAGTVSGRIILRITEARPAPSMLAASSTSPGTLVNPAM